MTQRDKTIQRIMVSLALYDNHAPETEITSAVERLDPESIGVLHGICGVLHHALSSKMPQKWLRQIHSDLLNAFECLSGIANENNCPARPTIIIDVSGGVVQSAVATEPIDAIVIDYDDADREENVYPIPQSDGSTSNAWVGEANCEVDPARVAEIMQALDSEPPLPAGEGGVRESA